MNDIPSDAVTAAAEAMEDEAMRLLGRDLGTVHRNDIARAALSAALSSIEAALRSKIAGEIGAEEPNGGIIVENAYAAAARIVRNGGQDA